MITGLDYLRWVVIVIAIGLPTIVCRVVSVSTVCELSVTDNNKLYNYSFCPLLLPNSLTGFSGAYGIICLLLLFKMILFRLVIQTVIYLVCKSFRHENIDKFALSDLEVYLGDYVPLKTN
jgi:hypothetical protein